MNNLLQYLENSERLAPNKTAIADENQSLSYSELVSLSKRIAKAILSRAKRDGSPVCVFAGRDVYTIAYFFGILYSGNYYVPIDPDMPDEKKKMILSDCKPIALCGNNPKGFETNGMETIQIADLPNSDDGIKIPEISERAPAYMVYTSGSTGRPKGVLKSHSAMISFIEAYCETFDFSRDEIIGNQTPFFFDASAKDLFLSIKLGATIEIIPPAKFAMPTDLIEYLNNKRITFISWVPSALAIVAQLKTFEYVLPKYLRKVFFVGEVMPVKYLNYWIKKLPDLEYVNLYGQSELAGISCYYVVNKVLSDFESLPMGRPLSNCTLYLIDNEGEIITGTDQNGEIYIVSDALANEYYNDPEKTAKSFFTKDFGTGSVRCFKSGDIAFKNAEGDYVFSARNDFQIKHMGHRIELGEIETIAGALPCIVRCACFYNKEKQSIVLFAETSDENVTSKQIKNLLRQKLSSYMIPEKIRIIDKMPMNANGKIHRQKLKELL